MNERDALLFSGKNANRTPEQDVADNLARRRRLESAPATPEERAAQSAWLAAVAARRENAAFQVAGSLGGRSLRLTVAQSRIAEATTSLDFLLSQEPEATGASAGEIAAMERNVADLRRQIAAGWFSLGEFRWALDALPEGEADDGARAHYTDYAEAEERPDTDECDCPRTYRVESRATGFNGAEYARGEIEHNNLYPDGDFPSARRACWVWGVRCRLCNHLNLRPDLPEAAAHELGARERTHEDVATIFAPRTRG